MADFSMSAISSPIGLAISSILVEAVMTVSCSLWLASSLSGSF